MSFICIRVTNRAEDTNEIIIENWSEDARVWTETWGSPELTPEQAREFAARLVEAADLVDAKNNRGRCPHCSTLISVAVRIVSGSVTCPYCKSDIEEKELLVDIIPWLNIDSQDNEANA